jgi:hypothetical protein
MAIFRIVLQEWVPETGFTDVVSDTVEINGNMGDPRSPECKAFIKQVRNFIETQDHLY